MSGAAAAPSTRQETPPHVMTIAGSDSGGGAGIQADLKTFEAWKCYGSSVLTGLTAQNTTGVKGLHEVPTEFVMQQLHAVWEDEVPVAVKLGMLTCASTVSALSRFFADLPRASASASAAAATTRPILVLDPVMISTSGHTLVPSAAMEAIQADLIRRVDWLTPNIPEALALAGDSSSSIDSIADMLDLLYRLNETTGVENLLLKGGHLPLGRNDVLELSAGEGRQVDQVWLDEDDQGECIEVLDGYRTLLEPGRPETKLVVDLLYNKQTARTTMYISRMVDTTSTHGTGCTLSSALACSAAHTARSGQTVSTETICRRALEYTKSAIASAYSFGKGHGPLNHAHLSYRRALPPPTQSNPHPFVSYLIQSDLPLWKSYVRHPFVVQLGNGTLPRECFEHYIKQDYLYLQHYARAHALGAYKATDFPTISAFTSIAAHIARESEMHVSYCASFCISLAELQATPESAPCAAYARYILDVGASGDLLELYVAVASCLIGYGEVGLWLDRRVQAGKGEAKMEGNLYSKWMEDYKGKDFIDAVNRGIENLERLVAADPPSPQRLARLARIWHECVRLERDFWEMGLKLQ